MQNDTHSDDLRDPLVSFFLFLKKRGRPFCIFAVLFFILGSISIFFLPKVYRVQFVFLGGHYLVESPLTTITIFQQESSREHIAKEYSHREPALADKWFDYTLFDRGSAIEVFVSARDSRAAVTLGRIISEELTKRHTAIIERKKKTLTIFQKKILEFEKNIHDLEKNMQTMDKKNRITASIARLEYVGRKEEAELTIKKREEEIAFNTPEIVTPIQEPQKPWQPNIPILLILVFACSLTLSTVSVSIYDRLTKRA